MGPVLYLSVYTYPHGNIVKAHGLSCHLYCSSIVYCSFKIRFLFQDQAASVQVIESCLNHIDACKHFKAEKDENRTSGDLTKAQSPSTYQGILGAGKDVRSQAVLEI